MLYPILKEGFTEFEIIINPDLDFVRVEVWKHGIKRYWGYDHSDKTHKLMHVIYPKSNFSRNDMKRILPKYKDCKLCNLGKKFIKGKNNNTIMNYSIVDLFGKIPKLGRLISGNRYMSEPIIMQTLATITRYPISFYLTPLGKRLISLIIGLLGEVGVGFLIKNGTIQGEWAEFFANHITSAVEVPAKGNAAFALKDELNRLKLGIKTGNFGAISSSLISDMASVKRAVRGYGESFKNTFNKFDNVFKGRRLRLSETTMPTTKRFGTKVAEDYKYEDTRKRFKDISQFGSGFRSKRRLRESGNAIYAAIS